MQLVTLISDFGTQHNGTALMKLGLLKKYKDLEIVEISHSIERGDSFRAAIELLEILQYAPTNTIHCVAIENINHNAKALTYYKINNQHFISPDNGVASLIKILLGIVDFPVFQLPNVPGYPDALFPLSFPFCVDKILKGTINEICQTYSDFNQRPSRPIKENNNIVGFVIFNNFSGDAITNIHFNDLIQYQNKELEYIKFGFQDSHFVSEINANKFEVEKGNVFCIISPSGFLTLGIGFGSAKDILGLIPGHNIEIKFFLG